MILRQARALALPFSSRRPPNLTGRPLPRERFSPWVGCGPSGLATWPGLRPDEAVEVPRNGDRSRAALRPASTLPGSRGRGMCDRRLDGRARIALGRGQAQNPSAHFRELRTQSGGSLNSIKSLHQGLSFPCQGRMIRRWPASVPRAWIIALSTPAVGSPLVGVGIGKRRWYATIFSFDRPSSPSISTERCSRSLSSSAPGCC